MRERNVPPLQSPPVVGAPSPPCAVGESTRTPPTPDASMELRVYTEAALVLPSTLRNTPECVALHPLRPAAFYSGGERGCDIYEVDLLNGGSLVGHIIASGRITRLVTTISFLCALVEQSEEEVLYVWDTGTYKCVESHVLVAKGERNRSVTCLTASAVIPAVFYARSGDSRVGSVDIAPEGKGVSKLEPTRGPVLSLACHPVLPWLASGHSDGTIRWWIENSLKHVIEPETGDKLNRGIVSLAFHAQSDVLVAASGSTGRPGKILAYRLFPRPILFGTRLADTAPICSVAFHPIYPALFTLSTEGVLRSWRLVLGGRTTTSLHSKPTVHPDRVVLSSFMVATNVLGFAGSNGGKFKKYPVRDLSKCVATSLVLHPRLNLISFQASAVQAGGESKGYRTQSARGTARGTSQLNFPSIPRASDVFYFVDRRFPLTCPVTCAMTLPGTLFYDSHQPILIPGRFFYVQYNRILGYSLSNGQSVHEKEIPFAPTHAVLRVLRLSYSEQVRAFLVIYETDIIPKKGEENTPRRSLYYTIVSERGDPPISGSGGDGVFLGATSVTRALIVSEDGTRAFLVGLENGTSTAPFELGGATIVRVFATPLAEGEAVAYFDPISRVLRISSNAAGSVSSRDSDNYMPSMALILPLKEEEIVTEVRWQIGVMKPRAAVMTDQRLLIVDEGLRVLTSTSAPFYFHVPHYLSCLWLADCVLYTTPTHLMFLSLSGKTYTLFATESLGSALVSILPDRICYVHWEGYLAEIRCRPVSLAEPLIACLLSSARDEDGGPQALENDIAHIVSMYDCAFFSIDQIERLCENGYASLATSLMAGRPYPVRLKVDAALKVGCYKEAVVLVEEEMNLVKGNVVDTVGMPEDLQNLLMRVGKEAEAHQQWKVAIRCYDLLGDDRRVYTLLGEQRDQEGLEIMLERTRNDPTKSDVYSACAIILGKKHLLKGEAPKIKEGSLWKEARDDEGSVYYWKVKQEQVTSWELPADQMDANGEIKPDSPWREATDDEGTRYYWTVIQRDKVTSWELPESERDESSIEPMFSVIPTVLAEREETNRQLLPQSGHDDPPVRQWTIAGETDISLKCDEVDGTKYIPSLHGATIEDILGVPMKEDVEATEPPTTPPWTMEALLPPSHNAPPVDHLSVRGSVEEERGSEETEEEGRSSTVPSEAEPPLPPAPPGFRRDSTGALVRTEEINMNFEEDANSDDSDDGTVRRRKKLTVIIKNEDEAKAASNEELSTAFASLRGGLQSARATSARSTTPRGTGVLLPATIEPLSPSLPPKVSSLDTSSTRGSSLPRSPRGPVDQAYLSSSVFVTTPRSTGRAIQRETEKGEDEPSVLMRSAFFKLESKGDFQGSLEDIMAALTILVASPDPTKWKEHIRVAVNYRIALEMLIEERECNDKMHSAMLTKFLSDVQLSTKHRFTTMKMAINKNMAAGNFGIAAALVARLRPMLPADQRSSVDSKLNACKSQGLVNAAPTQPCPAGCGAMVSFGDPKCTQCGAHYRFCSKTHVLISDRGYMQCPLCHALFRNDALNSGEKCPMCEFSHPVNRRGSGR